MYQSSKNGKQQDAIHFEVCNMPPSSSLNIEVMCNRRQMVAPNNHMMS
jgi:hypothetical protein